MSNTPGSAESFASLFEQSSTAHTRQRRYHPGESLEVTIVAVSREAVFADMGGKQEGFFDRTQLADPEGKVHIEVGHRVTAVVDSIDASTGQVRLRPVVIRSPSADVVVPSAAGAGPALIEGARVKGKVTGVERYGVFVQIAGTQGRNGRGLVHVMETGTPRGADLKKHFAVGQDVEAKILSIDESGKIRLSIAALGADEERGMFEAFKAKASPGGAPTSPEGSARKEKAEPRGFGKLGDLLGKVAATAKESAPTNTPSAARPRRSSNR